MSLTTTTVYWHRPLGASSDVRRLTIGQRLCSVWSTPIDQGDAAISCARLRGLEVDCPTLVSDGYLQSLGIIFQRDNNTDHPRIELQNLRCVHGCHDSVVQWFMKQVDWTTIELGSHSSHVFQHLPKSTIEIRIAEELSINDWTALVKRGQQVGGSLLRIVWLGTRPQDPLVESALLRHVIRDPFLEFHGKGVDGDLQWYSALNVWAHTAKRKKDSSSRLHIATQAVRIIKEWKRNGDKGEAAVRPVLYSSASNQNDNLQNHQIVDKV
jgi:hypothetical protein